VNDLTRSHVLATKPDAHCKCSHTTLTINPLPTRGRRKSWIDKKECLESVIKLPRGGRSTRHPDQQPIAHGKTCSEDQDQRQRGRQARSENLDQVPFNLSECAVNALLHLLQHPDLRFGINALLVDTLQGSLPKPVDTNGRKILKGSSIQVKSNQKCARFVGFYHPKVIWYVQLP
jgi:hypothetical protein